jgi:hypothetical protein
MGKLPSCNTQQMASIRITRGGREQQRRILHSVRGPTAVLPYCRRVQGMARYTYSPLIITSPLATHTHLNHQSPTTTRHSHSSQPPITNHHSPLTLISTTNHQSPLATHTHLNHHSPLRTPCYRSDPTGLRYALRDVSSSPTSCLTPRVPKTHAAWGAIALRCSS